MPYIITSRDRERARQEDVTNANQFFERFGEELFNGKIADIKRLEEEMGYTISDGEENVYIHQVNPPPADDIMLI